MMNSDVLIDFLELSLNFFLNAMFHRFSTDEVTKTLPTSFLTCDHFCANGNQLSRDYVRAEHH